MENFKVQTVHKVIRMLNEIEVNGEEMQYILEKVGMDHQMTKQLMMTAPRGYVEQIWDEIVELEKSHD